MKVWPIKFIPHFILLGFILLSGLLPAGFSVAADTVQVPKMKNIKKWGYQLQKAKPKTIAKASYDVVVIDYSRDGSKDKVFRRADIERMKKKPDGSRRIVLAYLSIGEAEDYRFYWREDWDENPPVWLKDENSDWAGNYSVDFWHKGWQKIIHAYVERIRDAGFDGVYLDRIDSYEESGATPEKEQQMISFVRSIAHATNRTSHKFYIVPQNAENLLRHKTYRAVISAVAKEDLLFGVEEDGEPNDRDAVFWSKKFLLLAKEDGLPVLVIEYLKDRKEKRQAAKTLRSFGFVPTFSNRKLNKLSLPRR